jgi:predicted RNA-binding protein
VTQWNNLQVVTGGKPIQEYVSITTVDGGTQLRLTVLSPLKDLLTQLTEQQQKQMRRECTTNTTHVLRYQVGYLAHDIFAAYTPANKREPLVEGVLEKLLALVEEGLADQDNDPVSVSPRQELEKLDPQAHAVG